MTAKDRAIQSLEWARQRTLDLLKDFPPDKAVFQPSPTDNHALWTMGHLAISDEWFHGMIADHKPQLPEQYSTLFGFQSKPEPAVGAYPPLAEVRSHFDAVRTRLIQDAKAASEQSLEQPLGEKGFGFVTDGIDVLMKNIWHEGWHAGQLAGLRKALGLKSAFGA